mmetsp:Transcript_4834/g.12388  ORF Transcript_4834/g.12388 Transcript_4834/m.12388 type:complete len:285 (-) Transcript_4834:134-988(-)
MAAGQVPLQQALPVQVHVALLRFLPLWPPQFLPHETPLPLQAVHSDPAGVLLLGRVRPRHDSGGAVLRGVRAVLHGGLRLQQVPRALLLPPHVVRLRLLYPRKVWGRRHPRDPFFPRVQLLQLPVLPQRHAQAAPLLPLLQPSLLPLQLHLQLDLLPLLPRQVPRPEALDPHHGGLRQPPHRLGKVRAVSLHAGLRGGGGHHPPPPEVLFLHPHPLPGDGECEPRHRHPRPLHHGLRAGGRHGPGRVPQDPRWWVHKPPGALCQQQPPQHKEGRAILQAPRPKV